MAAKIILLSLSAFVFYAIFYFSEINGLHGLAHQAIEAKTLPGTHETLRTAYTRIEPVDKLLTVLTTFFWPASDGSHPSLMLHTIGFSGTFGSAWVLVTLESFRRGNAWTIAAFPMIFGLTAQVLTFAFATPLYGALQLFTSITATKPTAANIRVPRAVLNALPYVFVAGYIVPSTLLVLPESEHITSDLKQIFIAIWQPWPAYVAILLTATHLIASPFVANDHSLEGSRATLSALRRVYAFAFANTTFTHIITWTVSLATVVAPSIINDSFRDVLHPARVFETPLPWSSPALHVDTVGQGVHAFLRWDYLIGSAGVLVWTASLYRTAQREVYGRVGWVGLVMKSVLLTAVSGPVGAAVVLMWERDELVFRQLGGLKGEVGREKKFS